LLVPFYKDIFVTARTKGYEERAVRPEIPDLVVDCLYTKDLKLRREEEKRGRETTSVVYIPGTRHV